MTIKKYINIIILLICSLTFSCSHNLKTEKSKVNLIQVDLQDKSSYNVSVQVGNINGKYFVYLAGEKKTIDIYSLDKKGKLKPIKQFEVTKNNGGIRALTHVKVKDTNLLIAGNKADNALDIYKVKDNGTLMKIDSIIDSDSTFIDEIVTINIVNIKNRKFLYAGGLDKGISCFEVLESGEIKHIQSLEDNDSLFLHGIIGMSSIKIKEQYFLVTGAFFDNGISCFKISENGKLEHTSNIKDNQSLFLNGTFSVNTVQLKDQNFILVGHRHNLHYSSIPDSIDYHGDGINIFEIDEQGQIELLSILEDDKQLKLKGSTRIEIIKKNEEEALVFIATRDDKGIQICSLKQNSILVPIKEVNLDYSVYNGMTVKNIGKNWYLFSGAYDMNRLESYLINFN